MATHSAFLQAHRLLPGSDHPNDPFKTTNKTNPVSSEEQPASGEQHPYHIGKIKIPDAEYTDEVPEHLQNKEIPGFPSTVAIVGKPGGGKTNLCMNLLIKPIFWRHFFDKIYLLGPTVKMDKLFKEIKVPDNQIVTEPNEFIPKLVEWVAKQKEAVENDPKTAPKCLFFFEDITAYRNNVQKDPEFARCFTTIRHHKSTALVNFHKYTALERTARINCMHICVFPVNRTDIEQIYKEYASAHLDMDDFFVMCRYCWKPDEENKKPFLYINMYQPDERRFRKCFTKIIDTSHFEGLGKYLKAKRAQKYEEMMGIQRGPDGKRNGKRKAPGSESKDGKDWMHGNPILESLDTSLQRSMGDMTKKPGESQLKKQRQEGYENTDGPFGKGTTGVMGNVFGYLR